MMTRRCSGHAMSRLGLARSSLVLTPPRVADSAISSLRLLELRPVVLRRARLDLAKSSRDPGSSQANSGARHAPLAWHSCALAAQEARADSGNPNLRAPNIYFLDERQGDGHDRSCALLAALQP